MKKAVLAVVVLFCLAALRAAAIDAESFGFSAGGDPLENARALQKAVDCGGEIRVSKAGVYDVGATVLIGDNTSLVFAEGVVIRKNAKHGAFNYVFLNRGARQRQYNKNISLKGLNLSVNNVDHIDTFDILGLVGQVSFFYVKNLKIRDLRCTDLRAHQFCIQVCTFEDLDISGAEIRGHKDGIHLGRGTRFRISDCTFATGDDAIALNAHDYDISNPEMGWIENGVIENIFDLEPSELLVGFNGKPIYGYFCRIISGTWTEWKRGMQIQKSDTVVSGGKMYRAQMKPDGKVFVSQTPPTHSEGAKVLDGIKWRMTQTDVEFNAGVRNVTFRNIFLQKARTASFSIHADMDVWSRSFYPDGKFTMQENLVFDNIRVLHDNPKPFLLVKVPVNRVSITNSFLRNNNIIFLNHKDIDNTSPTVLNIFNTSFEPTQKMDFIKNNVAGKRIETNCFPAVK